MPKIARWRDFPTAIQLHLVERLADRSIEVAQLAVLQQWVESRPDVPDGEWYKDFGSFKLCGAGAYPKTFLLKGQAARGQKL
jgi:hypothetical protein